MKGPKTIFHSVMAARTKAKESARITPRFRVVHRGQVALGPGKVELLEHVHRTGSIVDAAKAMDMSYMRAWSLIRVMNQAFREPVITTERGGKQGGGATVTETGLAAIESYRAIEQRSLAATQTPWKRLEKLLRA